MARHDVPTTYPNIGDFSALTAFANKVALSVDGLKLPKPFHIEKLVKSIAMNKLLYEVLNERQAQLVQVMAKSSALPATHLPEDYPEFDTATWPDPLEGGG